MRFASMQIAFHVTVVLIGEIGGMSSDVFAKNLIGGIVKQLSATLLKDRIDPSINDNYRVERRVINVWRICSSISISGPVHLIF
jgi:hypothetical protein